MFVNDIRWVYFQLIPTAKWPSFRGPHFQVLVEVLVYISGYGKHKSLSTQNICRRQLIIHEVCVLDLNRTSFSMATRGSTLSNFDWALVRLCHWNLSEAMQIKAFESLWNFEKIHAIFKQTEYLAFLTEVCVVILWATPDTRVVVVRFF